MKHKGYNGCVALAYYRGGVCGEEPFDDCSTGEPQRIVLGGSDVPVGVSEALYDMGIGEERTVIIPCEKAYGLHDSQGVVRYARSFIAGGDKLEEGTVFAWKHPVSGRDVPVKCIEATKDTVVIDFNHLLAGKDLEYWFKLVDVVDDSGMSVRDRGRSSAAAE